MEWSANQLKAVRARRLASMLLLSLLAIDTAAAQTVASPTPSVSTVQPSNTYTRGSSSLLLPSSHPDDGTAANGSPQLSAATVAAVTILGITVVGVSAVLLILSMCKCLQDRCNYRKWKLQRQDEEWGLRENPLYHLSTNEHFHAGGFPYLMRQNAQPNVSCREDDIIYNGRFKMSGKSLWEVVSETETCSCPPSPAVSSYAGSDTEIIHGSPYISGFRSSDDTKWVNAPPPRCVGGHLLALRESMPFTVIEHQETALKRSRKPPSLTFSDRIEISPPSVLPAPCITEPLLQKPNMQSSDTNANLCPNLPGEGSADSCEQCHLPQPLTPTLTLSDCTSDGGRYVDEVNDFSLEIPQGAISEGERLIIDVGVALFGPFQFPEGLRPVSPVFWVCVRDKRDFEFSKPVTVTIPHFLNLNNHKDIQSLGLNFLKADHEMNSEEMYNLKETDGDANFEPLQRYGILQTSHFCSLCIACRDTPEILEKTTFCITAVLPNSTIPVGKKTYAFFFVTLLNLKTCLRRVDELISKKNLKGYETLKEDFKFQCSDTTDPSLEIDISQPKHGRIGVRGKKKIPRSVVDIFARKKELSEDELKARENEEFYPPRFRLFLSCSQRDATLSDARIEFRGTTSDPEFGIYLDVPDTDTVVSIESQVEENKSLGINDLFQVKSQLMPEAARWRHIGLALGLRVHRLDSIRSNSRTSEDCLTAMATDWLNRAYDVAQKGKPTLEGLSKAVENPAGGNNPALALNILQNWTL